jgi:hypothetical protein
MIHSARAMYEHIKGVLESQLEEGRDIISLLDANVQSLDIANWLLEEEEMESQQKQTAEASSTKATVTNTQA